jgi:hypothetical protein
MVRPLALLLVRQVIEGAVRRCRQHTDLRLVRRLLPKLILLSSKQVRVLLLLYLLRV